MNKEEVIKEINSFDWGYEMSDDPRIFDKWTQKKKEIREELKQFDNNSIVEKLNKIGLQNWKRYFNNGNNI